MKIPSKNRPSIFFILILLIASGTASATSYYVSTTGDNSGTGLSPADAWATPSYAVSKVKAGDTIYLMAGTWYGEHLVFHTSGTKDAPITLTSYNGKAIMDGVDRFDSTNGNSIAIEISDYSKGLGYINISDIVLHNYYRGVYTRSSNNIHIENVEIYNTSYIAVDFIDSSYSSLTNSDIHDNGWNAVSVVTNSKNSAYISLINNRIHDNPGTSGGAGHNLIDLFHYGTNVSLRNVDIKNNFLYNGGLYASAIFEHGQFYPMYNMNVSNNVVYNTRQITLDRFANSVIYNNTLYDQPAYGFTSLFASMDNVLFLDNTVRNVTWNELRLTGASDGNYLILENSDISSYRIDQNTATILNPEKSRFDIRSTAGSQITVKFSDNKVFKETGANASIFSPASSSYVTSGNESVTFTTYPMTAKPSTSNVNIQVNEFDTTRSLGNVLADFTASSANGNNVDFTIGELQPGAGYIVKMDGTDLSEVTADSNGYVSFSNDVWSEHTFTLIQTSVGSTPISSATDISFTPSETALTSFTGGSTTFTVDSGQEFTSALWYLDDDLVESGTMSHIQGWNATGTHTVRFDGTAVAGTISRTWTITVSEPEPSEYSSISISPSSSIVAPGESFAIDVYIDPSQSLTGSQFDLLYYSQLASVSSVEEADLFALDGLATTFEYESIDNTLGIISHVYSAIVGSGAVSAPGTMATINMVAGSTSGILDLGLSDVILSDANSKPAAYTVSNATVLIDTAPKFSSISAQSVEEEQSLSFTVSAIDAEGDGLTYSSTLLPSGASFNAEAAAFSWTPSEGDAGTYEAAFAVTDGYLTDSVNVTITVTPLNHAPVITLFKPADASVFEEGSTINVSVAATDKDGQSLSYILKIDGLQVSTASDYSWTVDYESAGTHVIQVIVSDGIDEVMASSTVTITDLQPRWDVNEDGIVNVLDITLVGQNYGMTYTSDLPRWDVNQDGNVNIQDLSIVASHFGELV